MTFDGGASYRLKYRPIRSVLSACNTVYKNSNVGSNSIEIEPGERRQAPSCVYTHVVTAENNSKRIRTCASIWTGTLAAMYVRHANDRLGGARTSVTTHHSPRCSSVIGRNAFGSMNSAHNAASNSSSVQSVAAIAARWSTATSPSIHTTRKR